MASIQLQGDNSGSLTIQAPSDAGNNTLTLPATSSTLATQNALGVRNLIINGDMNIAQRGTSSAGVTSSGYYTLDRFDIGGTTFGTFTQSQDSDVPTGQGFNKSIKFLWTTANASLSANSFLQMHQSIEGQNLQHLKKGTANAESVTVSFWVKSNKTGTYIIRLSDIDNTKMICKSYTITLADTWEKKTLTFVGDTVGAFDNDNGRSLDLAFGLCAGTDNSSGTLQTTWGTDTPVNRYVGQVNLADAVNNYINITGVQLEVGDTATPFEHRPYDMELARCERYFQKSFRQEDAPAQNSHPGEGEHRFTIIGTGFGTLMTIYLTTTMRGYPSVTTYNPHNTNNLARNTSVPGDISGIGVGNLSNNSFAIIVFGTNHDTANGFQASVHWTASSEL